MVAESGHILVVDDHATNRLMLSMAVEELGYTVELAEDGRQALDLLTTQTFDLVLLDILMPQLNGYQVLQEMKKNDSLREIPVIVVSSVEDMDSVVACIESGAEEHLPKDFEPALFRARITSCLEKKRLRDAASAQLDFIRDAFGKYIPASVAEKIVELGDISPQRSEATILYTDIRDFTATVESNPTANTFEMLNEYYPAVFEPVTRFGGVVNQFQGDGIMAVFNVPIKDSKHATNAVKAAIEIQKATHGKAFAGVTLSTRIGINSGQIIAGNVGSGDRLFYAVHGDAVNVAARLEQLNKRLDTQILLSGSTRQQLTEDFLITSMGDMEIRGKKDTVPVFSLDY